MIFLFRLSFFTALVVISILAFLPNYSALPPIVSFSDLLNHATAFTVLTLLYRFSYNHSLQKVTILLLLYAIWIELVQVFLPTRYASLEDVIADSVGLLTGVLLSQWGKKFRPKMERTIFEEKN